VAARNWKDRRLRQAERLAEGGEHIRAARVLEQAIGLGLEECARLIEAYLAGRPAPPAPRALPEEVRRLAESGQQLRAVERLRELFGVRLEEAMRLVEEHLGMRPWWQDLADTPGEKGRGHPGVSGATWRRLGRGHTGGRGVPPGAREPGLTLVVRGPANQALQTGAHEGSPSFNGSPARRLLS
jgi:hypothetical protein